jgi:hypothetical protein
VDQADDASVASRGARCAAVLASAQMDPIPFDRSWAAASWQGARDNARRIGESMTLEEKLAWLESAEALAEELRAAEADASQRRDGDTGA